jgi:hypothetical protein
MTSAIANLLPACVPARLRQRIVTNGSATVPVNLTTISLSSIVGTEDGSATATAGAAHGFEAGDLVTIAGATPSAYNGTYEIISVPSTTTFTYRVANKGVAMAVTGTLTAKADLWFRRATIIGNNAIRTANTGTVYLGLSSTNDTQGIVITTAAERTIEAVQGARLNLADLWLDVVSINDGVLIFWH